ncbi:hypothetical protein BC940DRAFT_312778 [Gongronella butleri]|nr:hypothetical protein BC940DRAFT_312778 [Gongronella butleri]
MRPPSYIWWFSLLGASFVSASSILCHEPANPQHGRAASSWQHCTTMPAHAEARQRFDSIPKQLYYELYCEANDNVCDMVNATLAQASLLISNVIQFETPVFANVSFLSFCSHYGNCMVNKQEVTIGQAYPSLSYLMTDHSDNMTRMYPQALLKQFKDLRPKPNWAKYDIIAQFNQEANWYFASDDSPIGPNQIDLLRTVCHEMMHGLGFVTSWSDDLFQEFRPYVDNLTPFLTPMLLQPPKQVDRPSFSKTDCPEPFWGFVEYPMDKFLQYESTSLSNMTRFLSTWGNANVMFRSLIDMVNSWTTSTYLTRASALYQACTTNGAVTLAGVGLTMETSLHPYVDGSSLAHVDYSTYVDSPDYLMTYAGKSGITVASMTSQYPAGPVGPHLVQALQAIGYQGHPEYLSLQSIAPNNTRRPILSYWSPNVPLVGTADDPNPSQSTASGPARTPTASSEPSTSSAARVILPCSFFCIICSFVIPMLLIHA